MLTPLNDLQVCGGCSHICAQHQGARAQWCASVGKPEQGEAGPFGWFLGRLTRFCGPTDHPPDRVQPWVAISFHSRATYTGVLRNPNARPCSGCVSTRWRPKLRFFDRCVPCAPNDLQVVFVRRCELRAMHARKPEGRSGARMRPYS